MSPLESKRLAVLSKFSLESNDLGKTAMMKFLYLLQEVYGVSLKYDFEIYTYGPYSAEVMGDIDFAWHNEIISVETCHYPTGVGYLLRPTEQAKETVKSERTFIEKNKGSIDSIITNFGSKTAKELELITTIIYIYKQYLKNNWNISNNEISNNVREIKPHFSLEEVKKEYQNLENLKVFSLAS